MKIPFLKTKNTPPKTMNSAEPEIKGSASFGPTSPGGDVIERAEMTDGIFKAYIPQFLYKPPFGYPRAENILLIKEFANNPYVYSVIRLLQEAAAAADWDIVLKDDRTVMTPEMEKQKQEVTEFLENPNSNKESFSDLLKAVVRDIAVMDSGVLVKVFNSQEKMVQLVARDGGSFLKNPDIFGMIGNRSDIVEPIGDLEIDFYNQPQQLRLYDMKYKNQAAYFQYGWTVAAMPVPFGKREVVYFMMNPRSDNIYGKSPVQILADVILALTYGSRYNLDFYINGNMPEGVLQLIGASLKECKGVQDRMNNTTRMKDRMTGFMRKIGFKIPVVNVEAKFTPFQFASKELQIIEQQQWFTKIVWMCFGITADEMGFTEASNKAVSEEMGRRHARKAVTPILRLIEERVNMEILPEFGITDLKFKFEDYDLDEEIKKHQLYETQIRMGIKTSEMVAEEENIDVAELVAQKEEKAEKDMARSQWYNDDEVPGFPKRGGESAMRKKEKEVKAKQVKDPFANTPLEKELVSEINYKAKLLRDALKIAEKGSLQNVT